MQVSDMMTRDVAVVSPYADVLQAAQKMDWLNVGALPVCDGDRLVGIVTDRDITVRCTAAGDSPETAQVHEVMTDDVCWCFDDDPVEQVEQEMAYLQIRRLPVVDHGKRLVGMVSLGDLVTCRSPNVEGTLRAISEPSEPDRSGGPVPHQRPPLRRPSPRSPWSGYAEAPHMAFAPLSGRYAED